MMRVLFLLYVFSMARGDNESFRRIYGGKNANAGQFPFMASVRLKNDENAFLCGGFIVGKCFIVTSASCLLKYEPDELHVAVGSNHLVTGIVTYDVDSLATHPKFDFENHSHDIAVLRTRKNMKFNKFVQRVAMQINGTEGPATIVGWGEYENQNEISQTLRYLNVYVISNEYCKSALRSDYAKMIYPHTVCTKAISNYGTHTLGDSGGPLIRNGQVIGIISWSPCPCSNGIGMYTRINQHINFLIDQARSNCAE